jgi:hypothetical protein
MGGDSYRYPSSTGGWRNVSYSPGGIYAKTPQASGEVLFIVLVENCPKLHRQVENRPHYRPSGDCVPNSTGKWRIIQVEIMSRNSTGKWRIVKVEIMSKTPQASGESSQFIAKVDFTKTSPVTRFSGVLNSSTRWRDPPFYLVAPTVATRGKT